MKTQQKSLRMPMLKALEILMKKCMPKINIPRTILYNLLLPLSKILHLYTHHMMSINPKNLSLQVQKYKKRLKYKPSQAMITQTVNFNLSFIVIKMLKKRSKKSKRQPSYLQKMTKRRSRIVLNSAMLQYPHLIMSKTRSISSCQPSP